jgi:8-oxo-dGTP pyrophosphatase MutT (NUDIX family)
MAEILHSEPSSEHSYGIIPIQLINPPTGDVSDDQALPALSTGTTQVLLINQRSSSSPTGLRWTFPKGHPELGDKSTLRTALREMAEETGLVVNEEGILLKDAAGLIERYRNKKKGWVKEVRYWIGLVEGQGEPNVQEKEVSEARWMSYEEALDLATYERTKELLRQTMKLLDGADSNA